MADKTKIQWTDATWNPFYGCKKVSPGCKYCYMYRDQEWYGLDPTRVKRSKTKFKEPLLWKEPRKIFTRHGRMLTGFSREMRSVGII